MTDDELRARIEATPGVMGGMPCIRGTRLTVRLILNLLAHGAPFEEIFADYPRLTRDDILACLLYAADTLTRPSSIDCDTDERLVTISAGPGRKDRDA